MEEEGCGSESWWVLQKCIVWRDDPERQLIWPAVPGLQETPSIGPQGTTKHPAPGGAASFLEPSSNCEFPLLFCGAVILFPILRILNHLC